MRLTLRPCKTPEFIRHKVSLPNLFAKTAYDITLHASPATWKNLRIYSAAIFRFSHFRVFTPVKRNGLSFLFGAF